MHVVGCNSNSSGSSSIQTMLVDTTVLCLLLKGKRSISYEWNRRNPLIYTLTLLMKKLGLCSSRRTCRLTSNSASEMQSQCWVYTVPPSVEFLHYFFLLVAAAARTIIMTTSFQISSSCKFPKVYICHKLWNLVGITESYCYNNLAYFFGPPCRICTGQVVFLALISASVILTSYCTVWYFFQAVSFFLSFMLHCCML